MGVVNNKAKGAAERKVPTARPPLASVVNRLSARHRSELERLLTGPCDYMDHPCFANKKIVETLFSEDFDQARSLRPWCNAALPARKVSDTGLSRSRTLSSEEEKNLFLKLNYGRYRIWGILKTFEGRRLTARAAREVLWWQDRVVRTQSRIVEANVPLVLAMAKRTRLGNIDYAELISEGNMALLRSVDKFDCGRGFKFSTYACRAILKSFSRVAMKIGRYRGRFPVEFDPTLERSDYLDQRRSEHESDCVDELRGIIKNNAASLNEVEVKVLQARFALATVEGFPDDAPRTLERVGLLIGVTKERVRQIQNRALAKLRDKMLDDFLAA